jgi:alanine racemase
MTDRRAFLAAALGAIALPKLRAVPLRERAPSFDPWLEVDTAALRHNVAEAARLSGGRPVLAVVKNNAYGLGLSTVGPLLDAVDAVPGLAVVKTDEAIALRDAGVRKPILLMGLCSDEEAAELVSRDVRLGLFSDAAPGLLRKLAARFNRRIPVHLDVDTGMSRIGIPYHRALPWMAAIAETNAATIEGTFTTFAEDDVFDPEQLARFVELARQARERRLTLGRLHAASSHAVFLRPAAHLDLLRPGLIVYGAYPSEVTDRGAAALRPAFRLRAQVVRVEQLRPGDSVSYGRSYVATQPTWIATVPVGHSDGYPRTAVKGCEVLLRDRLYRVIGAVSASHCIVELGTEKTVEVGDVATLVGPDRAEILPNTVAERAGVSVYDILMHLSPLLPKKT